MDVDIVNIERDVVDVAGMVGEEGKLGVATTFGKLCTVAVESTVVEARTVVVGLTFVVVDAELVGAVAVNRILYCQ